jgi:hypothetical protein
MAEKHKAEVTLVVKDKRYTGKGKDILSAVKAIKEPKDMKDLARVEAVVDGKQSLIPIRLNPTKVKRLFTHDWEKELFAKRIDTLR